MVDEVIATNPENFFRTSDKIWDNIQDAFRKHQENMRELRSKQLKFYGFDIGTWVVTGTIEMAAAISGTPLFGVGAVVASQVTDAPKLKDIPGRAKELAGEATAVRKSPMALFFKHKR
jgi:hypothetical protein